MPASHRARYATTAFLFCRDAMSCPLCACACPRSFAFGAQAAAFLILGSSFAPGQVGSTKGLSYNFCLRRPLPLRRRRKELEGSAGARLARHEAPAARNTDKQNTPLNFPLVISTKSYVVPAVATHLLCRSLLFSEAVLRALSKREVCVSLPAATGCTFHQLAGPPRTVRTPNTTRIKKITTRHTCKQHTHPTPDTQFNPSFRAQKHLFLPPLSFYLLLRTSSPHRLLPSPPPKHGARPCRTPEYVAAFPRRSKGTN